MVRTLHRRLDDLVVGAPDDTLGGAEDSGSATYVPGSTSGLVLARSTVRTLGQVGSGGGDRTSPRHSRLAT